MRPTTYTKEMLAKAREYLVKYEELGELVPTVVGLCGYIQRSKSIVYDWAKDPDKSEFSDILSEIAEKQEESLIKGGLAGQFNSVITKMMLTKHGYSDKQELAHTSPDGSMSPKPENVDSKIVDAIVKKLEE